MQNALGQEMKSALHKRFLLDILCPFSVLPKTYTFSCVWTTILIVLISNYYNFFMARYDIRIMWINPNSLGLFVNLIHMGRAYEKPSLANSLTKFRNSFYNDFMA